MKRRSFLSLIFTPIFAPILRLLIPNKNKSRIFWATKQFQINDPYSYKLPFKGKIPNKMVIGQNYNVKIKEFM